jgi:hypothetical protein
MCLPFGLASVQDVKTVSKKLQTCIVLHHDLFDDGLHIYGVAQYCKVIQEDSVRYLFQKYEHNCLAVAEETAQGNDCVMECNKNSILAHFLNFLPADFIKEVFLEQMNQLIVPPCLFPGFITSGIQK